MFLFLFPIYLCTTVSLSNESRSWVLTTSIEMNLMPFLRNFPERCDIQFMFKVPYYIDGLIKCFFWEDKRYPSGIISIYQEWIWEHSRKLAVGISYVIIAGNNGSYNVFSWKSFEKQLEMAISNSGVSILLISTRSPPLSLRIIK